MRMTRCFVPARSEVAFPLIQLIVSFLFKFLQADSRNRSCNDKLENVRRAESFWRVRSNIVPSVQSRQ